MNRKGNFFEIADAPKSEKVAWVGTTQKSGAPIGLSYVPLLDIEVSNLLIINSYFFRMEYHFQDFYQVRNNCLLQYSVSLEPSSGKMGMNLPELETYTGKVTSGAQRRIKKAIDIMLQLSPTRKIYNPVSKSHHDFRLSFTTLTIPEKATLDGSYCNKELLEPFLRKLRTDIGIRHYIWKLELQKRNQVHYHITTPNFLHHQFVRDTWNNILRRKGHLKHFYLKHGHSNPNSTDIHAVHKIKNIEAYLVKYIAKTEKKAAVNSKIWDCSKSLKDSKQFVFTSTYETEVYLRGLYQRNQIEVLKFDHCTILKPKKVALKELIPPALKMSYESYLKSI